MAAGHPAEGKKEKKKKKNGKVGSLFSFPRILAHSHFNARSEFFSYHFLYLSLPSSTPSTPFFHFLFCLVFVFVYFSIPAFIMSDEVYEGAIGIDLGMIDKQPTKSLKISSHRQRANTSVQARPTLALPTMRAPMLRSVCCSTFLVCVKVSWTWDWLDPVANEQGSYTTPSFVSFTEKERLIGEAAKNQAAMNPKNTIFDIK